MPALSVRPPRHTSGSTLSQQSGAGHNSGASAVEGWLGLAGSNIGYGSANAGLPNSPPVAVTFNATRKGTVAGAFATCHEYGEPASIDWSAVSATGGLPGTAHAVPGPIVPNVDCGAAQLLMLSTR